jgi:endonuclease YncB( thermonuclease family)
VTRRSCAFTAALAVAFALAGAAPASTSLLGGRTARIAGVADGDTVFLTNGRTVRLVQIDTPEVSSRYESPECYGATASKITKRLLPPGTLVQLTREPATDSVDSYGRLLRYVTRVRGHLSINVHLVAVGAAAPYSTADVGAATPPASHAWLSVPDVTTWASGDVVRARRMTQTAACRPAHLAEVVDSNATDRLIRANPVEAHTGFERPC